MTLYEASIQYKAIKTSTPTATYIDGPQDAANALMDAFTQNPCQETVWILLLNQKKKLMARRRTFTGSPAEILRTVILGHATNFILAHNHTSGDPTPSVKDMETTQEIQKLAKIMGTPLTDHIIIGDPHKDPNKLGYFSFNTQNLMPLT
jgi:DNA repair protein RadC